MKAVRGYATVLAIALPLAACVHVDNKAYPEYWPAANPAESGCPDLSGTFDNQDLNEGSPKLLAKWLLVTTDPLTQVHRAVLAGPAGGVLKIRFLDQAGTELLSREWREGADFVCRDGWVEREPPRGAVMVGMAFQQVSRFARSARGDLIVRNMDSGGGLVTAVPLYASESTWHLYRQRSQ